jgi:2-amino-4-hydroxy-6-hydroxymethyldihydropteridine diphosphokinase
VTRSALTGERPVVLSLGSNLGDRLANLQLGIGVLCASGLACQAVSSVFQTTPVGGPDQDDYLNAVLVATSSLPAPDILARCAAAEAAAGRIRTARWGPRTLDVDIIIIGAEASDDLALTLPHPRAHERAFVLAPWLEVEPQAVLPCRGPVADLLAATGTGGVRRLPGLRLTLPDTASRLGPSAGDTGAGDTGAGDTVQVTRCI